MAFIGLKHELNFENKHGWCKRSRAYFKAVSNNLIKHKNAHNIILQGFFHTLETLQKHQDIVFK
jgi:hypothetical protein